MFLKVDVESGKLYINKSRDGPDDKCYVHDKSTESKLCSMFQTFGTNAMMIGR